MTLPTQRLRAEHAELLPKVEALKDLAHDVGVAPIDELRRGLESAYLFLENDLIPHARAEDQVLYPAIARILGSEKAMQGMTQDHVEVGTLANELGVLRVELVDDEEQAAELLREIRRVLYGLYALLKHHFAKEEDIYLPVIDRDATEGEAASLMDAMEAVSRNSRFSVI